MVEFLIIMVGASIVIVAGVCGFVVGGTLEMRKFHRDAEGRRMASVKNAEAHGEQLELKLLDVA